jgi:hypothetical protein
MLKSLRRAAVRRPAFDLLGAVVVCEPVHDRTDGHSRGDSQCDGDWHVWRACANDGANDSTNDDPAAATIIVINVHRSLRAKVLSLPGAAAGAGPIQ